VFRIGRVTDLPRPLLSSSECQEYSSVRKARKTKIGVSPLPRFMDYWEKNANRGCPMALRISAFYGSRSLTSEAMILLRLPYFPNCQDGRLRCQAIVSTVRRPHASRLHVVALCLVACDNGPRLFLSGSVAWQACVTEMGLGRRLRPSLMPQGVEQSRQEQA
jgi:hypothetical protein